MTPEALERAAQLVGDGEYAAAATEFDEALATEPEDPVALLGAARAQLALSRDEKARGLLLRLLLVSPLHPEALSHLAAIRFRRERNPAQLDELRALAAHPEARFPELYNLGVALVRAAAFDEAEGALQSARQLSPDNPFVLAQLGKLALRRGDGARALRDLERAIELAPREWYPLRLLARVHLAAGRLPEARAALDRALERFPDGPILLQERAQVRLALGQPRLALDDARRLDALHPESPQAAYLHGVAALTAGRAPEALEVLERAVRLAPKAAEPRVALARIKGHLGDAVAQQSLLEEACAVAPGLPGPALDLSNLLLRQDTASSLARARGVLETALQRHPEDPGLHLNLALVLRHSAPEQALPHARRAAASPHPGIADEGRRLVALLAPGS